MGNDIGNTLPGGKSGDRVPYFWSIQNNVVRDNYVQMLLIPPTVTMTYENL